MINVMKFLTSENSTKLYIALMTLALLVASVSGFFIMTVDFDVNLRPIQDFEARQILEDFQNENEAVHVIDLQYFYSKEAFDELTSLEGLYPKYDKYDFKQLKLLKAYSKTCDRTNLDGLSFEKSLQKSLLFLEVRCGHRSEYPKSFFRHAPFLDYDGVSFAKKAFDDPKNSYPLEHLVPYMHVLEWKANQKKIHKAFASKLQKFLVLLPEKDLLSLFDYPEALLSKRYVFLKRMNQNDDHTDGLNPGLYAVYDRALWDGYISGNLCTTINILASVDEPVCDIKIGNICWKKNVSEFTMFLSRYIYVFFGLSNVIVFLVFGLFVIKVKQDRLEEERRRFALRTLTHELRTPIASLSLTSEVFRDEFDHLPEKAQDAFGRLSSDIARLKRLSETSRQYLCVGDSHSLISVNLKDIPSMASYLECVLDNYYDDISIQVEGSDFAFESDSYWLGVCLKNLVENALNHGQKPVVVRAKQNEKEIFIEVEDQGKCLFDSIDELSKPFAKGHQSSGMGLGTDIILKVVKELDGKIVLLKNPTRFQVRLKVSKK